MVEVGFACNRADRLLPYRPAKVAHELLRDVRNRVSGITVRPAVHKLRRACTSSSAHSSKPMRRSSRREHRNTPQALVF